MSYGMGMGTGMEPMMSSASSMSILCSIALAAVAAMQGGAMGPAPVPEPEMPPLPPIAPAPVDTQPPAPPASKFSAAPAAYTFVTDQDMIMRTTPDVKDKNNCPVSVGVGAQVAGAADDSNVWYVQASASAYGGKRAYHLLNYRAWAGGPSSSDEGCKALYLHAGDKIGSGSMCNYGTEDPKVFLGPLTYNGSAHWVVHEAPDGGIFFQNVRCARNNNPSFLRITSIQEGRSSARLDRMELATRFNSQKVNMQQDPNAIKP